MKTNVFLKLIFTFLLAMAVMAGCSGSNGKNGATGPTDPTVSWVMPIQGATGVYTDSVIKVGFSKPISSTTINASTFLVSTGGLPVTGTISYNSGSQTAFFNPNLPLSQFGVYTVTLTTNIKDLSGNPIPATYSWTFFAGGSPTPAEIYVTDFNNPSLDIFNNAETASGNIAPDRIVNGASTTFASPSYLWLDKGSDRLYISDGGSGKILVFNNASTINGNNVAPSRAISSASLSGPNGIWLDTSTDTLYVVDAINNAILAFNNASTLNGTVTAARIISGTYTTLSVPIGIWLDAANDTLYITNWWTNTILVFDHASTASGNIAPSRTIQSTGLDKPQGIWLDASSDQLYVANQSNSSVTVFNNASTVVGTQSPSRTISGTNTGFGSPTGVWYDVSTDRLYVADQFSNSISVFNGGSTANGNIYPSRVISGTNTDLKGTKTLWLDLNP